MEMDLHISEIVFVSYYFDMSITAEGRQHRLSMGRNTVIWGLVIIWFQSILWVFFFLKSGASIPDRLGTSVIRDFLGKR